MPASSHQDADGGTWKDDSPARQAKIYLASGSLLRGDRLLFDCVVKANTLDSCLQLLQQALRRDSQFSEGTVVMHRGLEQQDRETEMAPEQLFKASGDSMTIRITCGDAFAGRVPEMILFWMLEICKLVEVEHFQITEDLSFIELTDCMEIAGRCKVPADCNDQIYSRLAIIANDQVPLQDLKALYARCPLRQTECSIAVESIGKAQVEKRLREAEAYHEYCCQNEKFKDDLEHYILGKHGFGMDGTAIKKGQDVAMNRPSVQDSSFRDSTLTARAHVSDLGLRSTLAYLCTECGAGERSKHSCHTHVPYAILSFDGPADNWSTPPSATANVWNTGATEWQDTNVPGQGSDGGWIEAGGYLTNNAGWDNAAAGADAVASDDNNRCRRCKEVGHFARECAVPRDDSCFNCGQPGHMSRDCTEPRKPRDAGRDRACYKCGESGHIAKSCTASSFGATETSGSAAMICFNCQQTGHQSKHCTEERIEKEYGTDPRTCNQCGLKGHISRNCRENAGGSEPLPRGSRDHDGEYDTGQDSHGKIHDAVEPVREELVTNIVSANRVRKAKKGRLGYVDVTQQLYDPRATDRAGYESQSRGSRHRGRGGRKVENPTRNRQSDENLPPQITPGPPAVAVEGDWADDGGEQLAAPVSKW